MRVLIGNTYLPTTNNDSVSITRSASDPVPTCTLHVQDVNSSIQLQGIQEILILDTAQIPNPTANLLLNPAMNPYGTSWTAGSPPSGMTFSQPGGGGLTVTFSNTAFGSTQVLSQMVFAQAGMRYCFSVTLTALAPVNVGIELSLTWLDGAQNTISGATSSITTPTGSAQIASFAGTAPARAVFCRVALLVVATNSPNSGSLTLTNAQCEPEWFPDFTYPTPYCGPNQINCVQLPIGQWIRQYRRFAGLVNHIVASDYHGNTRTLQIDAVGYAWLLGTIYTNFSYTNTYDSTIINNLLSYYLVNETLVFPLVTLVNYTNVVQGILVNSLQANWDDLRSVVDSLASQIGFYWAIDFYWNMIYAPPGYITMPISLICDNSVTPDYKTTYPAYNFSVEGDFTQPGTNILVFGNGSTNTAQVIDPAACGAINQSSGYWLVPQYAYMRKVNEGSLQNQTDCVNRGIAELLQYNGPRQIVHLTTNVELIPGEGVAVTSATDGLNASVLLVQQTRARWLGVNEQLQDVWEYQADLGATNRAATNIISRIFRVTQANSSAPAINAYALATFERVSVTDTP